MNVVVRQVIMTTCASIALSIDSILDYLFANPNTGLLAIALVIALFILMSKTQWWKQLFQQ